MPMFFAKSAVLILATNVAGISTADEPLIRGEMLQPYSISWHQCGVQDGEWRASGDLTESLVIIGNNTLRHTQVTQQADGITNTAITYFERASLAPVRMEQRVTRNNQTVLAIERSLTEDGYTGIARQGGEEKQLQGHITSTMLHGAALGLPLATIAYQEDPQAFKASMIGFDGSYDVVATWAGRDTLSHHGTEVPVLLVDIEWHHLESGDTYPAGPDASGGRYWIAPAPPPGFPYVPRYQTDSYAVEFQRDRCPQSQAGASGGDAH